MERAAKRQKTSADKLSEQLEELRQQSAELMPIFFSPEIQQLFLTEQEWTIDVDLLQGAEDTEYVVATGLVPAIVCGFRLKYHFNEPPMIHAALCSTCHYLDNHSSHPHSFTLKQRCTLSGLRHLIYNHFQQLCHLQQFFKRQIRTLPFSTDVETLLWRTASDRVERRMRIVHSLSHITRNSVKYHNLIQYECEKLRAFKISLPIIHHMIQSNDTGYHEWEARAGIQYAYLADIAQPVAESSTLLDAPLPHQAARGFRTSRDVTMLLKVNIVAFRKQACGLKIRIAPLTPTEHTLLSQHSSRLDGQLPTVLPYGCVLYA